MARTLITAAVLAASLATALVPGIASADEHGGYGWHGGDRDHRDWDRRGDDWRDGDRRGGWGDGDRRDYRDYHRDWRDDHRRFYREGYYAQPYGGYVQPYYSQTYVQPYGYQREAYVQTYRDNGYRCHSDGTGGAILGALAGGLIGHEIVGRGDRVAGTAIGGVGGLFAGRAIERSGNRC